jgi:hypothetical protein
MEAHEMSGTNASELEYIEAEANPDAVITPPPWAGGFYVPGDAPAVAAAVGGTTPPWLDRLHRAVAYLLLA